MARILLDENLDWRLRRELPGHEVVSVPLIAWAGLKNGELLSRAEVVSMFSSRWIQISHINATLQITRLL